MPNGMNSPNAASGERARLDDHEQASAYEKHSGYAKVDHVAADSADPGSGEPHASAHAATFRPYAASDGAFFIQSGHARFGELPGNVLLAFRPKKEKSSRRLRFEPLKKRCVI
jgi:hypothetical protein